VNFKVEIIIIFSFTGCGKKFFRRILQILSKKASEIYLRASEKTVGELLASLQGAAKKWTPKVFRWFLATV